jgi:hypothetical protein
LFPSIRLRAVALTPSRALLSRDFGERWCLPVLLEEAKEGVELVLEGQKWRRIQRLPERRRI